MKSVNAFDNDKKYLLLNKDVPLALFRVDDLYGEVFVLEEYGEKPLGVTDFAKFIVNRRAPKHRENVTELLKLSGCDTVRGFLDITHALSLIDTFWVKPVDSDLAWDNVSLYKHAFNEVVARTAFEGGLHGKNLSTTSPEYGTDGSFAKCWIRENEQIKMLKRGSSGAANAGLEPYSEFYAGQLISAFTNDHVRYDLRSMNGRICSVCNIFTSEEYGYLPFSAIKGSNLGIRDVLEIADNFGVENQMRTMFVVDAVIMNEDRHTNNFGFLINNRTQKVEGMAPLFDHNISLLPYAMKEDFIDSRYVGLKGPRIGESWAKDAYICMDSKMRKILINLLDFKFEKHKKFNLPDWRLEALERMIHNNIKEILQLTK